MKNLIFALCFTALASSTTWATPPPKPIVKMGRDRLLLNQKVYFSVGRAKIHSRSILLLEAIGGFLSAHPKLKIRIEVHTDSRGSARFNQLMSQKRANAIKAFLVKFGLSPKRLQAKGYGESRPIASNRTRQGRMQNRRTVFRILKH